MGPFARGIVTPALGAAPLLGGQRPHVGPIGTRCQPSAPRAADGLAVPVFVSSSPAEPAGHIYNLVPACVLRANETVTSHTLPQRRQPVDGPGPLR